MEICDKCGSKVWSGKCSRCSIEENKKEMKDSIKEGFSHTDSKNKKEEALEHKQEVKTGIIIDFIFSEEVNVDENEVDLVKICMKNTREEPCTMFVSTDLDHQKVGTIQVSLEPNEVKNVLITADQVDLRTEYEKMMMVSCKITDSFGNEIVMKRKSIRVKTIYDLQLKKLCDLVPRWVTPNSQGIKDLLKREGTIIKNLENLGHTSISGYQGTDPKEILDKVLAQMEAVFNAIRDMDVRYVSDVVSGGNTIDIKYQRVKMPKKILEERSGNCIEWTCLFASIYESMGLYPIILFPPGHAIVGVIVATSKNLMRDIPSGKYVSSLVIELNNIETENKDISHDDLYIIAFESTMVKEPSAKFIDAVRSGVATINDAREHILSEKGYSVIQFKRTYKNIKPYAE